MNLSIILLVTLGAFVMSGVVAFSSNRFLFGFVCPLAFLVAYLTFATLQTTGGRLEGIGLVVGFTLALLLVLGVPVAGISMLGASVGLYVAKRVAKK
jgi:hypothetical protein